MPNVGGKKFPYTSSGMKMAKEESAQTGQPVVKEYMGGGAVHYKSNGGSITLNNEEERYTVTQGHKNYKNKFKFA